MFWAFSEWVPAVNEQIDDESFDAHRDGKGNNCRYNTRPNETGDAQRHDQRPCKKRGWEEEV
jgi:hypothetical protein